MPSFRVTRKAHADLTSIGRYTEQKWGKVQRNIYLEQFDNCFIELSDNPKLGVSCDFIAKSYRKFPLNSHLIFYRQGSDGIVEIIRVLHKSMDIESKF